MFKSVTIVPDSLDAGSIAEALVYYGNVNLVVRGHTLAELIQKFGYDRIIRCIELGILEFSFERSNYVVLSKKEPPFEYHNFGAVQFHQTAAGRKIHSAADEVEIAFIKEFGNSTEIRKQARTLADKITIRQERQDIIEQSRADALNTTLLSGIVRDLLATLVPGYLPPDDLKAECFDTGRGLVFTLDLDWDEINRLYHRRVPISHSSISKAYLLAHLSGARKELAFASGAESDLWIGEGHSVVARHLINSLAGRLTRSRGDIERFHEIELEGRTFREAINTGERTVAELMTLLEDDETKKFKKWLAQQEANGILIKEYDRSVFGKHGWVDKLPFKLSKILVFAGIGATIDVSLGSMGVATLASAAISAGSDVALGASDEFVLSKMARGWRPNQFIEGPARNFLTSHGQANEPADGGEDRKAKD